MRRHPELRRRQLRPGAAQGTFAEVSGEARPRPSALLHPPPLRSYISPFFFLSPLSLFLVARKLSPKEKKASSSYTGFRTILLPELSPTARSDIHLREPWLEATNATRREKRRRRRHQRWYDHTLLHRLLPNISLSDASTSRQISPPCHITSLAVLSSQHQPAPPVDPQQILSPLPPLLFRETKRTCHGLTFTIPHLPQS